MEDLKQITQIENEKREQRCRKEYADCRTEGEERKEVISVAFIVCPEIRCRKCRCHKPHHRGYESIQHIERRGFQSKCRLRHAEGSVRSGFAE